MCTTHVIGIRTEQFTLSTTKGEWPGTVKVVEHLGSDTFPHVEVNAWGESRLWPQANSVTRTKTAFI